ncbi:MAG: ATP-binding cassette domain-containing protein [Lachnospiraceae bacterium]|nr:ATP-binding cassette domain-containing protein [Lachnospiraceae bacterium]
MSLEVNHLIKKYGQKIVVNDLSFSMKEPGVYALLGTNGAGKTTTIRMILGMLAKDSGEVLWKGKELSSIESNVGYLAEERGLYPKVTLMDQLLYFAKLKEIPKNMAKERIKYLAERLEVEEYLYPKKKRKTAPFKADQLSKGNQQKIQFMAALLSDPELLILDEPLSGLDPVNTDLFKSIIKEQIEKGKYLIMSSHQMATIEEFCSDITILNKGNAVLQGNLREIKKSYGRVNLYLKCDENVDAEIQKFSLPVLNQTPEEYHIQVNGQAQATEFLNYLLTQNKSIVKYELREPSLHEIFIEKVGDTHEET